MATYGNTTFKIANTWNQFYFPMASDIYVQRPFQEPISEGTYHGFTAWNVIIVDCPRYFPSNPWFKSHELIPLNIIKHNEKPSISWIVPWISCVFPEIPRERHLDHWGWSPLGRSCVRGSRAGKSLPWLVPGIRIIVIWSEKYIVSWC